MNKRGLSAVIGVVLLIGLTIVIGIVVFIFLKGFLAAKTESSIIEQQKQELCGKLDFSVDNACVEESKVINVDNGKTESRLRIKFDAGNNDFNVDIYSFDILVERSGSSFKVPSLDQSELGGLETGVVLSDNLEPGEEIKQIRIVPKVNIEGKILSCEEKEEVIENVKNCI